MNKLVARHKSDVTIWEAQLNNGAIILNINKIMNVLPNECFWLGEKKQLHFS